MDCGSHHDRLTRSSKLLHFETFERFEDLTHLTVSMPNHKQYLTFPESVCTQRY